MATDNSKPTPTPPLAIIGMSAIFPKAPGLKGYWRLLFHGVDGITEVPETHWSPEDYFSEDPKKPDHVYCKRGGFLSPTPFDPMEFGIPPATLESTDTSQLMGLVAAKMALADAGCEKEGRTFNRERTSVILGVTGTQELVIPLGARLGHPKWRRALEEAGVSPEKTREVMERIADAYVPWQESSFPGLLGNVVAGRISNRLDLGGANCVVDAACASSLGAIHLAALELSSGRSDMVITGGVDAINDIFMHMCFSRTGVLSPTGDARPFSKDADGAVLGEGVGMLVIKRLADAERDGDRIHAVLKGLGASSDGRSQSIYAPRVEGQVKALRAAYDMAGVDPADVEMIEAHGTGTRVGDRVEFTALNQVFSQKTRRPAGEAGEEEETRERWCALGSVKSMIGHTKAAAGAAGMIKAILALRNKVLPPTIKVDAPDPGLDVETSPFYLNTETRPWFTEKNRPRRCGISAFGFGGSNFHAVVEEYESAKSEIAWDGSVDIVALSSSSKDGLSRAARALANVADQDPSENELAEKTARTRGEFRASHAHRLLLVLDRTEERPASLSQLLSESLEILDAPDSGNRPVNPRTRENIHYTGQGAPGKIAFMFPGQGSQRPGMGRDLVCEFPAAFAMLETANRIAASESGGPGRLSDLIYPHPVFTGEERDLQKRTLSQTENAQPSIGAISAGMLAILNQFGVKPDVTCGHSFGELTALMAADWIDAETLMRLAVFRGRLMAMAGNRTDLGRGEDASGAMLAVIAPLADIEALLPDLGSEVILANRNGPNQGVLSGPAPAIERAATLCGQKGHRTLTLPVSAAFHGPMMADAHAPFAENLKKIRIAPTDIPVFSNTTAGPYPRDPDAVRALLAGHLLHPVNFIGEIEKLHESGIRTFVEVGPGSTLTRLVSSILKDRPFTSVSMDASVGKRSGKVDLARTLCRLAAEGAPVDLNQWDPPAVRERPGRMSIPILGANIRPRPTRAPKRTVEKTERPVRKKPSPGSARNPGPAGNPEPIAPAEAPGRISGARRAPAPSNPGDNPMHGKVNTMPNTEKDAPRQPGLIPDALKMVQEGLKSMQALQAQTAETHQKFLETQTEASRTLQEMIRNTSRLAEASMGVPVTTAAPAPAVHPAPPAEPAVVPAVSTGAARATAAPAPPSPGLHPAPPVEQGSVAVDPAPTPPAPAITVQPETSDGASPDRRKEIEKLLLSVVSDLTGYPEEMLGIDMDIEADLGIDSIKRVEILSTLEERMPNLPAVSPEIMGSMRTLGQIAGHLASDAAGQPDAADAADAAGIQERTLTRTPENRADAETAPSPRDAAVIEDALLTVVSDLTGYPREMIGLDMDIEADLGIDSIKRVEILSTLEEKLTDLPPVSPEAMGSLRTLAQIAAHLSQAGAGSEAGDEAYEMMDVAESAPTPSPEPAPPARETIDGPPDEVERYIASRREHPFVKGEPLTLPEGVKVFVTDDRTGLSEAITDALGESDINTVLISPDILKYKKTFPRAAGLIIVQGGDPDESSQALKNAFTLARHFGPDLMESAKNGGAVFATVTRVDGAFGFNDRGVEHPMSGGLPGLVKTAAREWPGVRCRAIDLSPGWTDNQAAAEAFKAEILTGDPDGPVEVGLDADARITLALEPSPLPPDLTPEAGFDVTPDDVIVLTGGARGVTASAAMALAQRARPTLALIGRSPAPEPEPDWLRPLTEPSAVKIAILENEFNGSAPTPVQLEKTFKARMANREIAETLHRLRQTGAEVSYFSADVRDPDAITPVFKAIRSAHGAVTALIHGAGVLEDRLIIDKTDAQLDRVIDTKVAGFLNLLDAVRPDSLKHLVLFTSVAARLGNMGQADYAMANEALNKIARREAAARPDCRVAAINWGPWDGGMVTDSLKREFQREGLGLIPLDAGGACMLQEMILPGDHPVEVVISAKSRSAEARDAAPPRLSAAAAASPAPVEKENLPLALKRNVGVEEYPILASHVIGGKPVVPFALMTEWFGHGALHGNPGLVLQGFDDMRVLKGIRLEEETKVVRLMAGKARKNGSMFEVNLELRDGLKENKEVIHSRARAILANALTDPPAPDPAAAAGIIASEPYHRTIQEVYQDILFHGVELHGVKDIIGLTDQGMAARLAAAPSPGQWVKTPLRSNWIGDPLVLDAAFQMATIWCFEKMGMVSLPSYLAAYRQHRERFPTEGVTAVLTVKEATSHKMRGDFIFLDAEDLVVARLTGYEAVMDETLFKSFKPEADAMERKSA